MGNLEGSEGSGRRTTEDNGGEVEMRDGGCILVPAGDLARVELPSRHVPGEFWESRERFKVSDDFREGIVRVAEIVECGQEFGPYEKFSIKREWRGVDLLRAMPTGALGATEFCARFSQEVEKYLGGQSTALARGWNTANAALVLGAGRECFVVFLVVDDTDGTLRVFTSSLVSKWMAGITFFSSEAEPQQNH